MNMRSLLGLSLAVAFAAASTAHAVDIDKKASKLGAKSSEGSKSGLGDALGGGLGLPALGSDSVGSAAGVLEYCVKNKYLDGAQAGEMKDKLLGKISGQKEQEDQYQSGLGGLLGGSGGKSFDLSKVSDSVKDKGCDYVLENAGSLL